MKLLLAVDGSKYSEAAMQAVLTQFTPLGTEVEVLNVVDLPLPIPTSDAAEFRELSLKRGTDLVQKTAHRLNEAGYKTRTVVNEGYPSDKILEQANEWKADVVVMGSHGRKGLERFLMGSVAESVSRHAQCSVEIVRMAA